MRRKLMEKMYPRFATEFEGQNKFFDRISKTLYYSKLPKKDCLSLPVTELAAEIFTDVKNSPTLERLDVEEAGRISRNACVSPCSLVMALIYVERLKDCNPEYLQKVAPSELFLVSLMVASKFLQDDEVYNSEWARSGELSIAKLNKLEREFLKAIKWITFVDHQDFWKRLQILEEDLAIREAKKRGWFSYTELNTLLNSTNLLALAQTILGISSVCIATYTAGLMTLLGSATVVTNIPKTLISLNLQTLFTGISDPEYIPFIQDSPQIEDKIVDILLESDIEKTEVYNQTNPQNNVLVCNCNNTKKGNRWNYFSRSIKPWFDYLNRKFIWKANWKNGFNHNCKYGTKKNFKMESDPFFVLFKVNKMKKKESLDAGINYYKYDMKYYIDYFPKYSKWLQ